MPQFVTGQAFQEAVDGIRSLFSAAQPFETGSLQVFQGSLAVPPGSRLELNSTHVRFFDADTKKAWQYSDTPRVCVCDAHGFENGDRVTVWSDDDDGLPAGLSALTDYYILAATADTFQLSLSVGGDPVDFAQASSGVLSLATPEAPISADGDLFYNALLSEAESDTSSTLWAVSAFREQYAPGVSAETILDVLADAEEAVEAYVTAESWALVLTGVTPYRLVRRVTGELAFWYLSGRSGVLKQTTSSSKKYADDVKEMTQKYRSVQSRILSMSEEAILLQLSAYAPEEAIDEDADAEDTDAITSWGTGRFVG